MTACGVTSMKRCLPYLVLILVGLSAAGCIAVPSNQSNNNLSPPASPAASVSPSPVNGEAANAEPLTLPVLDAFFAEEGFSALLRTRLHISDEQIAKLKELAHAETAKLNEENAGSVEIDLRVPGHGLPLVKLLRGVWV